MVDDVAREALERAFEDKDLLLVYQPIFNPRTGHIYAAEALLRQRRGDGSIREASIITQTAEAGPQLFALDSWTLHRAYTDASHWHEHGAGDIRLNVNLSPRQFQEGNILPRLTKMVTGCGIDTRKINLEITETTYIDQPEETMDVLASLKKLGINLWLDDFGTGHSSITHLQHFPLDGLKIPGAFVRGLLEDKRCRAITRSLINLAHDLGLEVIAEEIEKDAQLDMLMEWRCDYIQGFLLGRPMPVEEFQALMTKRSSAAPSDSPRARTDRAADPDPS